MDELFSFNYFSILITGELHVPLEVCGAVVMRELDFWQVDQHVIKACCWRHYRSYIENKRILDSFQRSLKKETFSVDVSKFEGWKKFQMQMWLILEHPRTSKIAMVCGSAILSNLTSRQINIHVCICQRNFFKSQFMEFHLNLLYIGFSTSLWKGLQK